MTSHADLLLALRLCRYEYERTAREVRVLQMRGARPMHRAAVKALHREAGDALQRVLDEVCE